MNIAQPVSQLAWTSLPRRAVIHAHEMDNVFPFRGLQHGKLLWCVVELVNHECLDIAKTFNYLSLHLGSLEFVNDFVHVRVLSLQVFLLKCIVLGLNSLLSLLLHRRTPFPLRTIMAALLSTDLLSTLTSLATHLQVIELLIQHHRLMHDWKVQPLTFLCLKILESLMLHCAVPKLCDSQHLLLLPFTIVTDLHKLLSSLSLTFDSLQHTLLVSLQDAKSGF